jgi:plastocyanin
MRRPGRSGVVFATLALGVGVAAAAAPAASTSAVQASGSEYAIGLSRSAVKPGKLRLEFVNFGEDDHDLAIRRVGATNVTYLSEVRPGERTVKRMRVKKGTYLLWCTISDHRSRGMRATLKVRKPT